MLWGTKEKRFQKLASGQKKYTLLQVVKLDTGHGVNMEKLTTDEGYDYPETLEGRVR